GAEHADGIGAGAVEPLVEALQAAEETAAAHADRDLDALPRSGGDIARQRGQGSTDETGTSPARKGLSEKLNEHAFGSHQLSPTPGPRTIREPTLLSYKKGRAGRGLFLSLQPAFQPAVPPAAATSAAKSCSSFSMPSPRPK